MKKLIFTILGVLMLSPVLSAAAEESDSVIAYTTYPNDVISYIYIIPVEEKDQKPDQSPEITYLKPPVFTSQLFAGKNYKTVLCGKYTICN